MRMVESPMENAVALRRTVAVARGVTGAEMIEDQICDPRDNGCDGKPR